MQRELDIRKGKGNEFWTSLSEEELIKNIDCLYDRLLSD